MREGLNITFDRHPIFFADQTMEKLGGNGGKKWNIDSTTRCPDLIQIRHSAASLLSAVRNFFLVARLPSSRGQNFKERERDPVSSVSTASKPRLDGTHCDGNYQRSDVERKYMFTLIPYVRGLSLLGHN